MSPQRKLLNYDVTRDGPFIMLRRGTHGGSLRVVAHWTEELKHILAGRHPLTPNPQYRGESRNFFVAPEAHHSQVTCGDINTGYSLRACRRETFPEPGINNLWRRTLSSALYRPRP